MTDLVIPWRELDPHLVKWRSDNKWPIDNRIPFRAERRAMARQAKKIFG